MAATAAPAAAETRTTTSAAAALPLAGRPDDGAAGARLAELFAAHGATVLGLCRMLLRNHHEAEDAVQQTFLSAYGSLLNGVEPRHPAAWLATIARNECYSRIEHGMRQPLGEEDAQSTLPDPLAAAAARADLQAMWQAIGELPRRQRKALLLREFSGLSYDELAVTLGVSEPTVESLLFRARRELRMRMRPLTESAASIAPLAAIREALSRAIGGMPDPSAGALAGLASATPFAAKLVTGVAVVAVAGGTVAAVETRADHEQRPPAPRAVVPLRAGPLPRVMPAPSARPVAVAKAARPAHVRPAVAAKRAAPTRPGDAAAGAVPAAPVVAAPPSPVSAPPPPAPAPIAAPAVETPPGEPVVAPAPAPAEGPAEPAREDTSGSHSSGSSSTGSGSDDRIEGSNEGSGSTSSGSGPGESTDDTEDSSGASDSSGPGSGSGSGSSGDSGDSGSSGSDDSESTSDSGSGSGGGGSGSGGGGSGGGGSGSGSGSGSDPDD